VSTQAPPAPGTTPGWSAGFKRRIPFYILIALLFSLLAGALVFIYLEDARSRMLPSRKVVIASVDISPGTVLTAEHLTLQNVPEGIVPDRVFQDTGQAIGRTAAIPILAKQVILDSFFVGAATSGLSTRLPDGRWGMVLPGDWLASPAPESLPGDRFDLLVYQPGRPADEAGVVVSNVQLLEGGTGSNLFTFAVTIEEAKSILYARSNGFTLMLLLRPDGT
jgi:Flp pilus assembly protein CpaB